MKARTSPSMRPKARRARLCNVVAMAACTLFVLVLAALMMNINMALLVISQGASTSDAINADDADGRRAASDLLRSPKRKEGAVSASASKPAVDALAASPRPHPHAGARDASGRWGYVADPNPRHFSSASLAIAGVESNSNMRKEDFLSSACSARPGEGLEGGGGNLVLGKVREGLLEVQQARTQKPVEERAAPRILCLVYTHSGNVANLRAIVDTWGKQCDGFIAGSNVTDGSIGSVDIPHLGPEEYRAMWQKVRSLWAYAYDNYFDDYDFFHICGDDTYIIVDNLRAYLGGEEVRQMLSGERLIFSKKQMMKTPQWRGTKWPRPLLLSMPHDRNGDPKKNMNYFATYPSGGSGYTFNREGLRIFAEQCLPNFLPEAIDPREDVFVGGCMGEDNGIHTADTRDSTGAWRYHSGDAEFQYKYDGKHGAPWWDLLLKKKHGIESLKGLDGASKHSVAFHLKRPGDNIPAKMYRYHVMIHGLCEKNYDAIKET